MKEQPEIIQKICGESGHSKVFITLEHDILVCFCSWIYPFIKEDAGNKVTQTIILGWLKSKEVLIGVFKKEQDLQYHQSAMGYTVEECLEYYGRFLG